MAAGAAAVLAIVAIAGVCLSFWAGVILLVYLAQNFAYSFWLKNIVIIDVMVLAFGFLLRVMAGVAVVQVDNFSPWLYVCVTLLALFLGFGKRRQEIVLLEEGAGNHRSSLLGTICRCSTRSSGMDRNGSNARRVHLPTAFDATTALAHSRMLLTVPFVFYFLTRYLYLVHVKHLGGAPDELLLENRPLLINSVLWAVSVVLLIHVASGGRQDEGVTG